RDLALISTKEDGRQDQKRASALLGGYVESALKLSRIPHRQDLQLYAEHLGRTLYVSDHGLRSRVPRIDQNSHPGDPGHRLCEQLEQLPADLCDKATHPRDVPAWPREAGGESPCNGVTDGEDDDRDGGRRLLRGADCIRIRDNHDIHWQTHEFVRK